MTIPAGTYRVQDLPSAILPLDPAQVVLEVVVSGLNRQTPLSAIWPPVGNTSGTYAAGDDPRLSDSRPPNGAAGGDLSGSFPTPVVSQVLGTAPGAAGLAVLASSTQAQGRAALGLSGLVGTPTQVVYYDGSGNPIGTTDLTRQLSGAVPTLVLAGQFRLTPVTPTVTAEGDRWNDQALANEVAILDGLPTYRVGTIWAATTPSNIASFVGEVSLLGIGVGNLTLPANFLKVGKVLTIDIEGRAWHAVAAASVVTFRVYVGGVAVADALLTVDTANPITGAFKLTARLACTAVGTLGAVAGSCIVTHPTHETAAGTMSQFGVPSDPMTVVSVNTTVSNQIQVKINRTAVDAGTYLRIASASVKVEV